MGEQIITQPQVMDKTLSVNQDVSIMGIAANPTIFNISDTEYTLSVDDTNSVLVFTADSKVSLYIPVDVVPVGSTITIVQNGTGNVYVYANPSVTLNSALGAIVTAGQHAQATLNLLSANSWLLAGDIVPGPQITVQPSSVLAYKNSPVALSVSATGEGDMVYTWRKNNQVIRSSSLPNYVINSVQYSDVADYDVIISTQYGSVTSNKVSLSGPVNIVTQPTSTATVQEQTTHFEVSAIGVAPLYYQWKLNSQNVLNATSRTYDISSTSPAMSGNYTVLVSNNYDGGVTSDVAVLTVYAKPTIIEEPISGTVPSGQSYIFRVRATGPGTIAYQWRLNSVNLTNENYNDLIASSDGSYDVIVSSEFGSVTSTPASLSIGIPPFIVSQPTLSEVIQGGTGHFTVSAGGDGLNSIGYLWKRDGVSLLSERNQDLYISNAQPSNVGSYSVAVSTIYGNVDSTSALLKVNEPAYIISDPVSVIVTQPQSFTFSVSAGGTGPFTYQWKKRTSTSSSTIIGGATLSAYSVSPSTSAAAGQYFVEVTNIYGSPVNSADASLTVNVPVFISSQPNNISATQGTTATFRVVAAGTGPFQYQWFKVGSPTVLSTTDSLLVSNVQSANEGSYYVTVSNAYGPSITSNNVSLTVNNYPVITNQSSTPVYGLLGGTATLSVTATSVSNMTYQWRKDGLFNINVPSGTTANLTLSSIGAGDAGSYTVDVKNASNLTTTSTPIVLSVGAAPVISSQPVGGLPLIGSSKTFNVQVAGSTPYTYVWKKGTTIVQTTTATLTNTNSYTINPVQLSDAGSYTVTVSNNYGATTSSVASIMPGDAPTISVQPLAASVVVGGSTSFSATANGTGTLTYKWQKNGVDLTDGTGISGSSTATLSLSNIQTAAASAYRVVITNNYGTVTSSAVNLTVNVPPSITVQPASVNVNYGSSATVLSVTVAGTAPYTYTWYQGVTQVATTTSSSTTNTYTTPNNLAAATNYSYTVKISNGYGSIVTSNAAIVSVKSGIPAFTLQPASANASSTTFTVAATAAGGLTISYQWYKDGSIIGGATGTSYTASSMGTYYCVADTTAFGGGPTQSNSAVLTTPPVITVQPTATSATYPATYTLSVGVASLIPVSYLWYRDGISTGITTSSITDYQLGSHSYYVVVTNSVGSVTSSTVVDTGNRAPYNDSGTIPISYAGTNGTTVPLTDGSLTSSSASLIEGDNLTLSVNGNYSSWPPSGFQWRKDGVNISGATSASLTLTSVTASNAGVYSCAISNSVGSTISASYSVSVTTLASFVSITQQPIATAAAGDFYSGNNTSSITAYVTKNVTLSITSATPSRARVTITYAWSNTPSSTTSTVALNSLSENVAGTSYTCNVYANNGNVRSAAVVSNSVTVKAIGLPGFTATAPAAINSLTSPYTLSSNASGTSLSYQWYFAGFTAGPPTSPGVYPLAAYSAINGATGASLSVTATVAVPLLSINSTEGAYKVTISSPYGPSVTSSPTQLTFKPVLNSQPSYNSGYQLSVSASGYGTLSYQWYKSGSVIPGATSSTYDILNSGTYYVIVSNSFGTVQSNTISVSLSLTMDALIVGGGGGGGPLLQGALAGGGGGAGAYRAQTLTYSNADGNVSVVVGAGGNSGTSAAGGTSSLGSNAAGGGGAAGVGAAYTGNSGGSGGGASAYVTSSTFALIRAGGSATLNGLYGCNGGDSYANWGSPEHVAWGGGGGGAGGLGATYSSTDNGAGGNGLSWFNGSYYAGGGTAVQFAITNSTYAFYPPVGRVGGGGTVSYSGNQNAWTDIVTTTGTANTGGGGAASKAGGSGIVIVRYPGHPKASGGTITSNNGYTYHSFTAAGTFRVNA